jgi:hypothetical protein
MAGKNTSKSKHVTSSFHIVRKIIIYTDEWEKLEQIANCKFANSKRAEICRRISSIADWKKLASESPRAQDIKRTLQYIARLKPVKAIDAFNNSDFVTNGLIFSAAVLRLKLGAPYEMTGEIIIAAAKLLLIDEELIPKSKGGSPVKVYHQALADYCRELWIEAGNADRVYQWGESIDGGMLEFSSIIFNSTANLADASILDLLKKGRVFTL